MNEIRGRSTEPASVSTDGTLDRWHGHEEGKGYSDGSREVILDLLCALNESSAENERGMHKPTQAGGGCLRERRDI